MTRVETGLGLFPGGSLSAFGGGKHGPPPCALDRTMQASLWKRVWAKQNNAQRKAPPKRGVVRHQKVDAESATTNWALSIDVRAPLPASPTPSMRPSSSETAPWPPLGSPRDPSASTEG